MNISYNWLKKYIDLSLSPRELAEKFTMAGLEVESIDCQGKVPDGVVTAKILSRKKHENSDHLSVCEVDKGDEVLQIVCGAPNCDAGNIVPLATIGTVFPDGDGTFTIKKGKLRGVESFGMMCSARELGLGNDHNGLMILPADTPLGIPMGQLVESDTVYDCSVTPNRPDWLSHIGVARDVAALLGKELKVDSVDCSENGFPFMEGLVTIEDQKNCPLYAAHVMKNVKVGESPDWMKKCLTAAGVRPIDNIVDITNFVMMEYGVPLHAFDIRNLKGEKIVVRPAKAGESIVALDGKKYDLKQDNLCICDEEKPVAIAGVMGGEYSGVQADTTTIVLESAYFDPDSIRLTSRHLGLASDASHRYERGVDREAVIAAGHRAMQLIHDLAGGECIGYGKAEAPAPAARVIPTDFQRIRNLLGMDVSDARIDEILKSLGFTDEGNHSYKVPSWRSYDVMGEADLAEEVARIHGLDKLPDVPIRAVSDEFKYDTCASLAELRTQLCASGLDEIVCGSMIDEKAATADGIFTADDLIKVNNPISLDLAVMRPSLLPGILNTIRYNIARKNNDLALFEAGHVFCKNTEKFPEERDELAIALTGCAHPERFSAERTQKFDFFDLKGILESVLSIRRIRSFSFEPVEDKRFIAGTCAALKIGGKTVGVLGQIIPALTKGMRLNTPLFVAIIQLPDLMSAETKSVFYVPVSQFPATDRDIAFLASGNLENRKVIEFIQKQKVPFLEKVSLFDIFVDKSLGEDKKSLAYNLSFRAPDRTLTDDEVNKACENLRNSLQHGLNVELR